MTRLSERLYTARSLIPLGIDELQLDEIGVKALFVKKRPGPPGCLAPAAGSRYDLGQTLPGNRLSRAQYPSDQIIERVKP